MIGKQIHLAFLYTHFYINPNYLTVLCTVTQWLESCLHNYVQLTNIHVTPTHTQTLHLHVRAFMFVRCIYL